MRPASRFVAVARKFNADIRVRYNGNDANGKSLLDLLCLAASEGNLLDLEARGHDAEAAIGTLAELLTTRHDEAQGEGLA